MERVFIHPHAGVLSAYGMGLADLRAMREGAVEAALDEAARAPLAERLDGLEWEARAEIRAQGIGDDDIRVLRRAHLRYAGTDTALIVDFGASADMRAAFETVHEQRFGFVMEGRGHVVEAVSVEAIGSTETVGDPEAAPPANAAAPPEALAVVRMVSGGAAHDAPVYDRARLAPGDRLDGPAIIVEANATSVVEPGWRAELTGRRHLVLSRAQPRPGRVAVGTGVDPVMLEIFNNLFMSIAEQMGAVLANTAYSVNIKERLDFSCAVFDTLGHLVANAPHIPVHLGSMGESVQTILHQRASTMRPGDVYVLNAPYNGGTHLPDVTVVTPVFDQKGSELLFCVASRGHHADIGGITPASMPPHSRTVDEEGVLIDDFHLVAEGRFRESEITEVLTSGRWPARNPRQNIADLRAQVAANEKGVQELAAMVEHFGLGVVRAYMGHVQDNAEESVRRVLGVLSDGAFSYEMDDGSVVAVRITIDKARRRASLDFADTSPQQESNFNAPFAVCRSAVLYVFRTLVDDDIPLNAGCLKPLDILVPDGSLLRPRYPAAVVAGNVETSNYVTDVLFGALGVQAASQGTVNNFTFGNDRHQYYETICGGSGAGPGYDGTDAVHTHMTNTRLTDPEVLEWRHPVRVEEFRRRTGSGGRGRQRGGDGVVRRIRFLEPMTAAILSSHRRVPPYGMDGGGTGAVGRNRVERADGRVVELAGTDQVEMEAGDVFVIETPGGGGFGAPETERESP